MPGITTNLKQRESHTRETAFGLVEQLAAAGHIVGRLRRNDALVHSRLHAARIIHHLQLDAQGCEVLDDQILQAPNTAQCLVCTQ